MGRDSTTLFASTPSHTYTQVSTYMTNSCISQSLFVISWSFSVNIDHRQLIDVQLPAYRLWAILAHEPCPRTPFLLPFPEWRSSSSPRLPPFLASPRRGTRSTNISRAWWSSPHSSCRPVQSCKWVGKRHPVWSGFRTGQVNSLVLSHSLYWSSTCICFQEEGEYPSEFKEKQCIVQDSVACYWSLVIWSISIHKEATYYCKASATSV